jgi:filamentous hemagglutinin family protein
MIGNERFGFNPNWYVVAGISLVFIPNTRILAQSNIVPDNTLGNENSIVTPDNSASQELVTGGAQRGQNLFHSFQEFNITEGRGAYFVSPNADIANIFSRVTGSNVSQIFGTIGTSGASQPNLFLINPNGIIFGENASLNVGGSFLATTADIIQFEKQGFFSASNPETPPLLTIQPSAFLVNQLNPGRIENNSVAPADTDPTGNLSFLGLRVPDGESLSLLGGDVVVNSGGIVALDGQINLAAVESGRVAIEPDTSFRLEDNSLGKNVSLTNGAGLLASGNSGGKIAIAAENIDISGNSNVITGILSNLGSTEAQAKDIELTATGNIAIDNSFIFNTIQTNATGNGGNLVIDTDNLSITNGGQAGVLTFGTGDTGNIRINARDEIDLNSNNPELLTGIFARTRETAIGNAGNIDISTTNLTANNARIDTKTFTLGNAGNLTIDARSLILTNGASLDTSTFGSGNAGNLTIDASEAITISGENTEIRANVGETATGQIEGGDLTVNTQKLVVEDGALISTSTFGAGNAGNLSISATESVNLTGEDNNGVIDENGQLIGVSPGGLLAQVEPNGIGNGGNLTINTSQLSISDGSKVQVATFGRGNAGELLINAKGIDIFNTSVFSQFTTGIFGSVDVDRFRNINLPDGDGGDIEIVTEQLNVINGGKISVTTRGIGNAGTLNITARSIEISGVDPEFEDDGVSLIGANVTERATGRGGDINIITGDLKIGDRAEISVSSLGNGRGGDINIQGNNLTLDNNALLNAQTLTTDGGNIDLQIVDLITSDNNSNISATAGTAQAGGDGGNISIDTQFVVAFPRGSNDITANAFAGAGGNIEISAESLFGIEARLATPPNDTNDLDASSQFGLDGNISLETPDVDPARGLENLPTNLVDASGLITSNCLGSGDARLNEFVITGRGGLPNNPNELLLGDATLPADWVSLPDDTQTKFLTPNKPVTSTNPIVEAKSWKLKPDGTVVLVAESNAPSLIIPWLNSNSCRH